MKILKNILTVVAITLAVYACTSDGESRVTRFTGSDLSELEIYYGSDNGVQTVNIGGDTIQNMDSLKLAIMNNYFKSLFNTDRGRFSGGDITYNFGDNRVTYINRRNDTINQIVSTYEFRNDSLFIDLSNGRQFFAGLGSSISDIHFVSGFAYFKGMYQGKDTIMTMVKSDTLLTNQMLSEKFGFAEDLSDMTANDTIVWCNVKYLFSK